MKNLLRALSLSLLALVAGCTTPPPAPHDLTSPFGRDHALTGKIWDTRGQRFISAEKLASALSRHDFILLGERHDNLDHHKLQAWLVQAMADHNRMPAVAFEMIAADKADALKVYQESDRRNADALDTFVDWKAGGWPAWEAYKPIADAALFNGMKLAAANLPPAVVKDMINRGRAALPQALADQLKLPDPIPGPMKTELAADVREAHCNSLPESLILPFADIQFIRDAVMAQSLRDSDSGQGAILIAGTGHARKDRGVPWHLAAAAPKKTIASLAFVEVEEGKVSPADYAAGWNAAALPFDYVWFSGRATRDDPCAALQGEKYKKSP